MSLFSLTTLTHPKAYHGASKAWKTEPVKKSPLCVHLPHLPSRSTTNPGVRWYNKPYTAPAPQPGPSKPKPRSSHVPPRAHEQVDGDPEPDTAPLDFDTFVPTHDPSLAVPSGATTAPFFVPPPSSSTVSRDEAFSNALSAMYWGGYWTAVYHVSPDVPRVHA